MKSKMGILELFIIFVLATNFTTNIYYCAFFLMIGIIFFKTTILILKNNYILKVKKIKWKKYDLIPFIFILIWLYGLLLGLYLGNEKSYVMKNFAGMVIYSLYYIIIFNKNITRIELFNLIIKIACFVLFFNLLLKILRMLSLDGNSVINMIFFANTSGGASTGQDRIFFIGQVTIFCIFMVALGRIFNKEKYIERLEETNKENNFFINTNKTILVLFLSFFSIVFIAASKGYMLALIVLFILFIIGNNYKNIIELKIKKNIVWIIIVSIVVTILLLITNYSTIISAIFAKDDIANVARYNQLYLLIEDINIVGRGLGAVLPGGYVRNSTAPYGFEITFVNIFHKFGLIAIILIVLYIYTILKAAFGIDKKNNNMSHYLLALGAMAYIFPSIGNPILFSPQTVVLHVVALVLMRKEKINQR